MHWEKFWPRPHGKSRISKFYFIRIKLLAVLVCLFFLPSYLLAQQKTQQPPPASVTLVKVTTGKVAPQSEFIGTI